MSIQYIPAGCCYSYTDDAQGMSRSRSTWTFQRYGRMEDARAISNKNFFNYTPLPVEIYSKLFASNLDTCIVNLHIPYTDIYLYGTILLHCKVSLKGPHRYTRFLSYLLISLSSLHVKHFFFLLNNCEQSAWRWIEEKFQGTLRKSYMAMASLASSLLPSYRVYDSTFVAFVLLKPALANFHISPTSSTF